MEKTFKELILEKEELKDGYYWMTESKIIELLQQVREATIAECLSTAIDTNGELFRDMLEDAFDSIPTDRILITENEE